MPNITARNFGIYGLCVCWAAALLFIPLAGFSAIFLTRHLAPQATVIHHVDDASSQEGSDAYRRKLVRESDEGLALLVRSGSLLLIDLLVFIAHWIFSWRMHRLAARD
jgi:hypothetical protein